jgi:hypothetical protein
MVLNFKFKFFRDIAKRLSFGMFMGQLPKDCPLACSWVNCQKIVLWHVHGSIAKRLFFGMFMGQLPKDCPLACSWVNFLEDVSEVIDSSLVKFVRRYWQSSEKFTED